MGQAAPLSCAVCSASSDKPLLLHLIASLIKEGHRRAQIQLTELTSTRYWHCSALSDWFLNLKLSIFGDKTGNVFFAYLMPWMGKRGPRKCSKLPQLYSFCLLNYHKLFRVLSFWSQSFCLSMLCMHEQGGGMHSKPNLHEPQQGENDRERKSKERERLSAKNT